MHALKVADFCLYEALPTVTYQIEEGFHCDTHLLNMIKLLIKLEPIMWLTQKWCLMCQ